MKAVILALAAAGVASTASLNAQIIGSRHPVPTTTRTTSVDGSWRVVGQDRNGTIYERRTYDANGNIIVQPARRDVNGNFTILSTRTGQGTNSRDCQLASTNTTVGGIILGRGGVATNCSNDRRAADGVWRQVGQGRNNNSIYERRTLDANGNVVIQRARRNPDGTFTILNTHTAHGNNGVRNRGRDDDDDQGEDNGQGRRNKHSDDDYSYSNGDDGYNSGNYVYDNSDYRYSSDNNRYKNSEHKNRGRGKGKKGRD